MIDTNTFLRNHKLKTFEWGEHDCLLFALDYLNQCEGVDFTKKVRGEYSNKFGSLRFLKESGYSNLKEVLDKNLTQVDRPCKGCLALVETSEGSAVGFVPDYRICVVKDVGFGFLPLSQAKYFYKVSECHK